MCVTDLVCVDKFERNLVCVTKLACVDRFGWNLDNFKPPTHYVSQYWFALYI